MRLMLGNAARKQLKMGGSSHDPKERDRFEFDIHIQMWRYIFEIIYTTTHSRLTALPREMIFNKSSSSKISTFRGEYTREQNVNTMCS